MRRTVSPSRSSDAAAGARIRGAAGIAALLLAMAARAAAPDSAPLAAGPGAELVRAHCGGCHSLRLVTAQRGDRAFWERTIRWMQRTQNLWTLPPEQEARLLTYLAEHYDEQDRGRRPPLSPTLMP